MFLKTEIQFVASFFILGIMFGNYQALLQSINVIGRNTICFDLIAKFKLLLKSNYCIMRTKEKSANNRRIRLLIGFIFSLTLIWTAFEYKSPFGKHTSGMGVLPGETTIQILPITKREKKLDKPKPKPKTTQLKLIDDEKKADDFTITVEVNPDDIINDPIEYDIGDDEIVFEHEKDFFVFVEEPPSFKGGTEAMLKFIGSNLIYPDLARQYGVSGTVYVSFIVEKDGNITNIEIERGIGFGCDAASIDLIKSMPKWNPGKQREIPVRVKLRLPVKFKLKP